MVPTPGFIFLVLGITVKNNAIEKGFDVTNRSITLSNAINGNTLEGSRTTLVRGGLENPILSPTRIEQNDQRTGQIVFGVSGNSTSCIFNLIDDRGAVLSSATTTV